MQKSQSDASISIGPSNQRRLNVDALRGLAVLLMIEQHLGVWLWRGPGLDETMTQYPWLFAINVLGGGAAPLFVTLAGVGTALLVSRYTSCDALLVRRGLMILAFGVALNFATPSWFSWRSWFVLHLIGVMIVASVGLRRLSSPVLVGLVGFVFVVAAAAQVWLATPVPLDNVRMAGWLPYSVNGARAVVAGGVLRLAAFEGHFPIFPWAAFYLGGMIAGRLLLAGKLDRLFKLGLGSLVIGLGLAALGPSAADVFNHPWAQRFTAINVPFYPASPAFVFSLMGMVLLCLLAGERWEARRRMSSRGPMVVLGRASLTLLIVHVVVFRQGAHEFVFWRVFSTAQTAVILVGVFVIAVGLTRRWAGHQYRYGAEWILRSLA